MTYLSKGGQNKTVLFKSASTGFDMWRNKAHECKGGPRGFAVIRLMMEQKRKETKRFGEEGMNLLPCGEARIQEVMGGGVWKREREIRQVGL